MPNAPKHPLSPYAQRRCRAVQRKIPHHLKNHFRPSRDSRGIALQGSIVHLRRNDQILEPRLWRVESMSATGSAPSGGGRASSEGTGCCCLLLPPKAHIEPDLRSKGRRWSLRVLEFLTSGRASSGRDESRRLSDVSAGWEWALGGWRLLGNSSFHPMWPVLNGRLGGDVGRPGESDPGPASGLSFGDLLMPCSNGGRPSGQHERRSGQRSKGGSSGSTSEAAGIGAAVDDEDIPMLLRWRSKTGCDQLRSLLLCNVGRAVRFKSSAAASDEKWSCPLAWLARRSRLFRSSCSCCSRSYTLSRRHSSSGSNGRPDLARGFRADIDAGFGSRTGCISECARRCYQRACQ